MPGRARRDGMIGLRLSAALALLLTGCAAAATPKAGSAGALPAAARPPVPPAPVAPLPGLKPGATVRLGPGPYPLLTFQSQHFDPPVTILAGASRVMGLRILDSSGIIWRGGDIRAPKGRDNASDGPNHWGVDLRRSDRVTFENTRVSDASRGMVFADSRGIVIRDSVFRNLRNDGIDIAGTRDVVIENNNLSGFFPVKATGSRADGTWKDGDHPDAIQVWSTRLNPTATDIVIRGNTVEGDTQGINLFGPALDGFARVTIANNSVNIAYPAAITVFSCDTCTVRDNRVWRIPGSPYLANIRFEKSTGKACGNTMPDWPDHFAKKRCK